jgi:small-conductance mechanosensitive channel/CRP-like cAMP-binding protein
MPVARRVVPPLLLFALLAVAAANQDDLLHRFSSDALQQAQLVFRYGLQVAIWLSAAYLVNRLILVFAWDGLVHRALGFSPPRLLSDVTGAVVYLIAITGIVGVVFQQPITGFWATSGVVGLVIGLALRNVILDVFIGLAVNVDRPYHLGDFIMLQTGQVGRVVEINWRTTRVETNEGNTIIVPNSRIGDMVVTNFSKPNTCAEFELLFSLDFSVPSDRVLRVLTAAAMAVTGNGILEDEEHEPKARIKAISHEGVEYKLKYWVDCAKVGPGKARHRVLESVLDGFHQAGLAPSQPKQDLFYAPMPNRQLDTRSLADRMELLSRIELFSTLEQSDLETLALDLNQLYIDSGQKVITQGEPGDSMFIVIEGLLHVLIDFQGAGQQTRVGHVRAGEFFGEMSMLTGEPRTATVAAATDTLIYQITKADMDTIFLQRPELAEHMSHVVAKRKLANDAAYLRATAVEKEQQQATLARQILHRIRTFFGAALDAESREADAVVSH